MPEKALPIRDILARLAATPGGIAALTAGLSEAQLHARPSEGEWSANEVLAHLRSCNDVWGAHILAMVAEDRPARKAISPRTYIKSTDYLKLDFAPSLQAFTEGREALLSVLTKLPPEGWQRTATATGWGQTNERVVVVEADRLVRHEQPHIRQIKAIVRAHHT